MPTDGSWICRACWKANRPGDDRCYRCHTPRNADEQTIAARRGTDQARAAKSDLRDGLDLLVALPAVVFSWYWRVLVLGGVLVGIGALLTVSDPNAPSGAWLTFAALAVATVALGLVMRWAVRGMRKRNPAAFAVGVLQGLFLAAFSAWALRTLPADAGNPVWERYASMGVFGASALLALVGLAYCTLRAPAPAASAPTSTSTDG